MDLRKSLETTGYLLSNLMNLLHNSMVKIHKFKLNRSPEHGFAPVKFGPFTTNYTSH